MFSFKKNMLFIVLFVFSFVNTINSKIIEINDPNFLNQGITKNTIEEWLSNTSASTEDNLLPDILFNQKKIKPNCLEVKSTTPGLASEGIY